MLLLRCCYLFCMLSKFTSASFWVLRSWSHIFQVVYSLSQLVLYLIANSLTKAWCVWLIIGGIFVSCKLAICKENLYPDDSIPLKSILWLFYFIHLLLWSQCRSSTVLVDPFVVIGLLAVVRGYSHHRWIMQRELIGLRNKLCQF